MTYQNNHHIHNQLQNQFNQYQIHSHLIINSFSENCILSGTDFEDDLLLFFKNIIFFCLLWFVEF